MRTNHHDGQTDGLSVASKRQRRLQCVSNLFRNRSAAECAGHDADPGNAGLHGGKKAIGRVRVPLGTIRRLDRRIV